MDRRRFVKSVASVAGAASVAGCATGSGVTAVKTSSSAPTYVLVHGAWHGGWCWRDVRSLLEESGANVFTPTLSGLGERAHLAGIHNIGLDTHIQDVVHLIEYEELENVILVGHSYAGLVITGVADLIPDKLSHAIYLDAIVVADGGSLLDEDNVMTDEQVAAIVNTIELNEQGMLPVPPLSFLGLDPAHPLANWVQRQMTPHPVKTLTDRLSYEINTFSELDKTYILCTEPITPGKDKEKLVVMTSSDDWRLLEIATSHDAMVTEPAVLIELFARVASMQ